MADLLKDDFIDDGGTYQDDDFPVQLPMVDTGKVFKEDDADGMFSPLKVSTIKTEPSEDVKPQVKSISVIQDLNLEQLLKHETKDLFFIQVIFGVYCPEKNILPLTSREIF